MRRWVWLWVVVAAGTAWAQEQQRREFPLRWASAEEVAALFGAPAAAPDEASPVARAALISEPELLAKQVLPPPPGTAGRWVLYVESANLTAPRSSPGESARTLNISSTASPASLWTARKPISARRVSSGR